MELSLTNFIYSKKINIKMKAEESLIEWKDVPKDEVLRIKRKEGEFIRFT
jgi:hypothetical protein